MVDADQLQAPPAPATATATAAVLPQDSTPCQFYQQMQ
jgi:hypothetical protein